MAEVGITRICAHLLKRTPREAKDDSGYGRINNHEISVKLDQALCGAAVGKMEKFTKPATYRGLKYVSTYRDPPTVQSQTHLKSKVMRHAVDALTWCHLTLKRSYATAFCLAQNN